MVQEDICQAVLREVLRVAWACHLVVGMAYLQVVSQHYQVAERGMAASLEEVGRLPCVVVGTGACLEAHHQGLEAYRWAEGKAAFRWEAWALPYR